eukprot:gene3017-3298_t
MRGKAQEAASDVDSGKSQNGHVCFLAISDTWMAACTFAEVLGYSGLLLSFSTATLQAYVSIASNRLDQQLPGPGPKKKSLGWARWTQQLLLVVSLLWWLTGGTLLQVHLTQADAAGVPQPAVRAAVSACCWLSVVLLAGLLALDLLLRPGPPSSTGAPPPRRSSPELPAAPQSTTPAATALAVLPAAAGHSVGPAQLQMALLASGLLQAAPAVRQHHISTWAAVSPPTATSQGSGAGSSRSRSATASDLVMRVAVINAGPGRSRSHSHQQMPSLQGVQPFGQRDLRGQQHRAVQHNSVVQHQAPKASGGR